MGKFGFRLGEMGNDECGRNGGVNWELLLN